MCMCLIIVDWMKIHLRHFSREVLSITKSILSHQLKKNRTMENKGSNMSAMKQLLAQCKKLPKWVRESVEDAWKGQWYDNKAGVLNLGG